MALRINEICSLTLSPVRLSECTHSSTQQPLHEVIRGYGTRTREKRKLLPCAFLYLSVFLLRHGPRVSLCRALEGVRFLSTVFVLLSFSSFLFLAIFLFFSRPFRLFSSPLGTARARASGPLNLEREKKKKFVSVSALVSQPSKPTVRAREGQIVPVDTA